MFSRNHHKNKLIRQTKTHRIHVLFISPIGEKMPATDLSDKRNCVIDENGSDSHCPTWKTYTHEKQYGGSTYVLLCRAAVKKVRLTLMIANLRHGEGTWRRGSIQSNWNCRLWAFIKRYKGDNRRHHTDGSVKRFLKQNFEQTLAGTRKDVQPSTENPIELFDQKILSVSIPLR
jgi:hypothetical protein